jgi:nucleoside-diphosphate-sugar epimerase
LTSGSEEDLIRANVDFTRELGALCLRQRIRLVHLGSAAEYGAALDGIVRETTTTDPISQYGRTKLAGSTSLMALADDGLDVTIARVFNVIGPGQPLSTPIGEFAAAVRALPTSGGAVRALDSSLIRDFATRGRVAEVLLRIAQVPGRVPLVNVCSGRGLSFAELIMAMARVRGVRVRVEDTRPGGIPTVVGDPSTLQRLIGRLPVESADHLAHEAMQPNDPLHA